LSGNFHNPFFIDEVSAPEGIQEIRFYSQYGGNRQIDRVEKGGIVTEDFNLLVFLSVRIDINDLS
jgi:uncharacterized protein YneR